MVNFVGLLELKFPISFDEKKCINVIKSKKECDACEKICPANAIDLESPSVEASKCTLCGACSLVCPTEAIKININYVDSIKSLEKEEISVGCAKSNKAEVVLPCLLALSEKDLLNISSSKKLYIDISACENCVYSFSKDIKNFISKTIYLSKIFKLKYIPSFVNEDYKPKFRYTHFKNQEKQNFKPLNIKDLCSNTIPFEGKFGYIEVSKDCNLCGACVSICPQKAIKLEGGLKFSHGLCIACGLCEYACAISHPLKPLTLRKAVIPSKYSYEYEYISKSDKRTCENCGKTFYTKEENQNLCLFCQKEQNLQNMILDFLK
ncbi:MAG: 4Fe-4S ferredoxin [Hydrogenobaculum sp.]|nr:MAG: 4Fe-4S ferredoxin [Hydrogenobaculum sp.]PMP89993.1 MAG: 4Fe-4S ferredoxin [Hydrogenobaculum sp.]